MQLANNPYVIAEHTYVIATLTSTAIPILSHTCFYILHILPVIPPTLATHPCVKPAAHPSVY